MDLIEESIQASSKKVKKTYLLESECAETEVSDLDRPDFPDEDECSDMEVIEPLSLSNVSGMMEYIVKTSEEYTVKWKKKSSPRVAPEYWPNDDIQSP